MAGTSVLKLVVDDKQYEASLKNARQGMLNLQESLQAAGKTFSDVDGKVVEYARALGQMDTVNKTAKGRISEMSSTFVELKRQYLAMTDAEKSSPLGQAMSKSLDELKTRTLNAKQELADINKELNETGQKSGETGGILDKLSSKFVVSFDAVKMFNVGLQAAEGALKVAKDAFFASEQNVDEWGRIMASSQSLYEGFVTSLNNSDFTGFMSRIDDIVKAAREAYNELDRLGTMKTIQAPQIERQNSENVRMRTMLMTGRYIAPSDGRAPLQGMKTGDLLSPAQIKTLERQLQGGMNTIVKLTQNELDQTGRAIDAYYNKLAKENGMTMEEFKKGTSSMSEFDQRQEGYRKYQQWRQENSFTDMYGNRQVREGNPYQEFKKWGTFRVDKMGENSYNDLVVLIRQQQQQQSQIYSTIGQAYRTINRAEGVTVKGLMNPGGGGGRGGSAGGKATSQYIPLEGSIDAQTKKVQELQKAWRAAADDDSRKKIKEQIEQAQAVLDFMNGKVVAPDGSLKALNEELDELNKQRELLTDPIEIEIIDNQIQDIKDEIDQLNGKKVEIEIVPSTMTPFEQLKQSLTIQLAEENIQVDETTLKTLMQTAIQNGIDGLDPQFASLQEKMREGMNIPDSAWEDLQTQINEKLKELDIEPIKIDFKTGTIAKDGKDVAKEWNSAANAISSVGSAMQSIEDPSAKIVGTIAQAIATIALTYAQSLKGTFTPWDWIAGAASGMATMMSVISAIHSATGYAQGGIVKGNSYSGDNIMANGGAIGLNAGELVLNKAQQSTLASELQNGGNRIQVVGRLSGEQLFLCAENWSKRTGKGEFVTW